MKPARSLREIRPCVPSSDLAAQPVASRARNHFGYREWAGAFGDLGTLIPFVLGYISVVGMPANGVLIGFGISMILCGAYYGTPFPVQPMKAIGAVALAQTGNVVITAQAVGVAGIFTGAFWLALGRTRLATRLGGWVGDAVASGIVAGLAIGLMLAAVRMMAHDWTLATILLAATLLLSARPGIPVMLLLLIIGAGVAAFHHPLLIRDLTAIKPQPTLPAFLLTDISWHDLAAGLLLLALPQLPLTLANAVIATTRENNRLFPERPVSERQLMLSTGIMNLGSVLVGGVPMCHGAGGMAGQVRFGARTGGAPIILGSICVLLALFFSHSVKPLFSLFPVSILGVILVLAGAQLGTGSVWLFRTASLRDRMLLVLTAMLAPWNIGVAFVTGVALDHAARRWWPHH